MSDSEEEVELSAATLAVLNEFMAQKQLYQEPSESHFEEDWQLSQFWVCDFLFFFSIFHLHFHSFSFPSINRMFYSTMI